MGEVVSSTLQRNWLTSLMTQSLCCEFCSRSGVEFRTLGALLIERGKYNTRTHPLCCVDAPCSVVDLGATAFVSESISVRKCEVVTRDLARAWQSHTVRAQTLYETVRKGQRDLHKQGRPTSPLSCTVVLVVLNESLRTFL